MYILCCLRHKKIDVKNTSICLTLSILKQFQKVPLQLYITICIKALKVCLIFFENMEFCLVNIVFEYITEQKEFYSMSIIFFSAPSTCTINNSKIHTLQYRTNAMRSNYENSKFLLFFSYERYAINFLKKYLSVIFLQLFIY